MTGSGLDNRSSAGAVLLSYSSGTSATPLLGVTIGQNLLDAARGLR